MPIDHLDLDLLICIAELLKGKDLIQLVDSSRIFRPLAFVDCLWKKRCSIDYGLEYNHPEQSYRQLYMQTTHGSYSRRPCCHLSSRIESVPLVQPCPAMAIPDGWKDISCRRCLTHGIENLFLCLDCDLILCDRHARLHSQLAVGGEAQHCLFYKPNMVEIFCQICIDWLGGCDNDPSEQYHVSRIAAQWATKLYTVETQSILLKLRTLRQLERSLRWKDTPQRALQDGICFVSAGWIAIWENFVEGWATFRPPLEIDHTQWNSENGSLSPSVKFCPFALDRTDVVIISTSTWNYLTNAYGFQGSKITEENLTPPELYKNWHQQLDLWKKSVAK